MKKIILILCFVYILGFVNTFAEYNNDYLNESVDAFINSPSLSEIDLIEDENTRYCEQVYLEATRRREYTTYENLMCSDIFRIKAQQEIDYMNFALGKRGIFY